ncbi:molecular chaperone Tir [Candidatus Magnetomorum sp. HK-1]|nr:molecular chaperone Tir [Candidatus Magnetomorum sp. HK-1]
MNGIRLYNKETQKHREMLCATVHSVVQKQCISGSIIEPDDIRFKEYLPIEEGATEHLLIESNDEITYFRSYLAVSTSSESGINKRLNKIQKLPSLLKRGYLKRVIFGISMELPRQCNRKIEEVLSSLGNEHVQFELWEAKDIRQLIKAHHNIICPSLFMPHLEQLIVQRDIRCSFLSEPEDLGGIDPNGYGSGNEKNKDNIGSLFVSHASEDKPFIDKLIPILDKYASKVWYDKREILVGDSITHKINEGLSTATALMVVLSKSSTDKQWVIRELGAALNMQISSANVKVLPVLLENCEIPPLLRDIKYADFTNSFETGVNQLISGLQGMR